MKKENIKPLAAMIFGSFLVWMIVIALISMLSSCAGQKPIERTHLSLVEIKQAYGLSNSETRGIVKAAKNGEIELIYHTGRDCWMYDAKFDYSQFKGK